MATRRKTIWVICHTAADTRSRGNPDTSALEINDWHLARGWDGIGYHYVIRLDGTVERGRASYLVGAHAKGFNSRSIGICFSGDGQRFAFTQEQMESFVSLFDELNQRWGGVHKLLPIGHREINKLIDVGLANPEFRTTKTCPGIMVDMDELRDLVDSSF